MRSSRVILLVTMVAAAGISSADQPFEQWSAVPPGTPSTPSAGGPSTPGGQIEALTFWNDRGAFNAAFPGLPTENWSGTIVPAGGVASCAPPLNSTTNDACFTTGSVLPGIELDINVTTGGGQYVVLGVGFLGNVNILVGPNSFVDDLIFNFNPAVRAAGFDLVNPMTAGQTYNVTISGPGGVIGTTTAVDGPEGNFWGVDSTDVGGITSIVFDGGGSDVHSELTALVTFGGEPVPVELQSIDIE